MLKKRDVRNFEIWFIDCDFTYWRRCNCLPLHDVMAN